MLRFRRPRLPVARSGHRVVSTAKPPNWAWSWITIVGRCRIRRVSRRTVTLHEPLGTFPTSSGPNHTSRQGPIPNHFVSHRREAISDPGSSSKSAYRRTFVAGAFANGVVG